MVIPNQGVCGLKLVDRTPDTQTSLYSFYAQNHSGYQHLLVHYKSRAQKPKSVALVKIQIESLYCTLRGRQNSVVV